MNNYIEIRENAYLDSVTLMLLYRKLIDVEGIPNANVSMGTDHNKSILKMNDFASSEIDNAGPNDLIIAFSYEYEETKVQAMKVMEDHFNQSTGMDDDEEYSPHSLEMALKIQPDSNLALISVPGENAAYETEKCLEKNMNVMIFSDNMDINEEKRLKQLAREKGLLVMGADCGTAIINGKPLAFANCVRKGDIGIVGASGTGIQEISVAVHKLNKGISQAIGTGGRDLSLEIGGITMLSGLEALMADPETKVIILVSKPPAKEVAVKLLEKIKETEKPVVVHFIGGNATEVEKYGGIFSETMEEAAVKACKCLDDSITDEFFSKQIDIDKTAKQEIEKYSPEQKYLRGLYTGGTLCKEAILMLHKKIGVYSNIPLEKDYRLKDSKKSEKNTIIDLGEDEFTKGRPHPMIDPASRAERILQEGDSKDLRVILLDVVLGYGSHEDPAGAIVDSIKKVQEKYKEDGKHISVIASICGCEEDPQVYTEQLKKLEDINVIVPPTNAQAVKLTEKLMDL